MSCASGIDQATVRVVGSHDGLVFLEKPAGLPVFPPHRGEGPSVLAAWLALCPGAADLPWPGGFEGGIAHRLDTDTSGLLLACENPARLAALREEFADGRLLKRYLFVSLRSVPWDEHRAEQPIAHDLRHHGRMIVQRGADTPHRGRWFSARTTLLRWGEHLWEARIETGVTHQIRVHAAFLGLALAGDRRYGGGTLPAAIVPPPGSGFLLHHLQAQGPGWESPSLQPPEWWGRFRPRDTGPR
jgi:23S rRNA pseudouridine1911/1915/1917 synthase